MPKLYKKYSGSEKHNNFRYIERTFYKYHRFTRLLRSNCILLDDAKSIHIYIFF